MTEATAYWNEFADNTDGSHLPCINDQLALWDVTSQVYQDPLDDFDVATYLLQCYALSSRVVRNKLRNRAASSHQQSSLPHYVIGFYELLCSSWHRLRIALESLASPSPTLVNYSRLRNRGSPWQLGYLSSTESQWRALCLITTEYVELIQLITDAEHLLSDSISTCFKDEQTLFSELLDECSESQTPDPPTPPRTGTSSSPFQQSVRWNLSYTDPWPQWRCIAFSPEHSTDGCSSRQVAIGYSSGSIEVIDLLTSSSELNGPRQTNIVLSSPCYTQSTESKTSFFPITHVAFVDKNHLLACHFSGLVDLWHLDWEAKRFPARLMTRICPEELCPNKPKAFPVTAAEYDPNTSSLVLGGLSSNPAPASNLNQTFELHSFLVSLSPPYLKHVQSSESTKQAVTTGVVSYLRHGKTLLSQWISETIRHMYRAHSLDTDAVAFLHTHSCERTTVTAALHCSGTCSVWSLPHLDPLFLVLGCASLDVHSSPTVSMDVSQPFRLTWWAVPHKKEDSDNSTATSDHSEELAQLVVLRERGELSILKFGDTQIDKLVLDERQVHELNLSSFASFAYVDQTSSGKIILLDHKAPSDVLWKTLIYGDKTDANRRVLRAIRLSATSPSGLYNHLIRKGCYQDAIQLALRHQQDVELVYQQQWLDLSRQVSNLSNLPSIIDSTLALVRHRPLWVLRQCLSFLPSPQSKVFISARDFFASLRHLLQLGLGRVSDLSMEHSEQLQEAVRAQLLRRLFHIECLSDILLAELVDDEESCSTASTINYHYPLNCLVENLQAFRQHALLDIARFFADSERFSAVRVLMNKFPVSVGSHRLAIASSLCETIHPSSYMTQLLEPPSFSVDPEPHYASRGTEFELAAVERLYSTLTFPSVELTVECGTQDSNRQYAHKLIMWLMKRARQIDSRSGLVTHSLALLEVGETICLRLIHDEDLLMQPHGLGLREALILLRRLRLEFTQLSRIIYEVPKGTRTHPTRTNISVQSSSRQIALARFSFSHFSTLSIEDRIDLLLQITPSSVRLSEQKSPNLLNPVLCNWGQIMVYIRQLGDTRYIRRWTTYSLIRLATYHRFDMFSKLAGMLEAGTLCQLFQEVLPPLPFEQSRDCLNTCSLTGMELLTCMLEAISQYDPALIKPDDKPAHQSMETFKVYLKDMTHLINLLFRCISSVADESTQLTSTLQLFSQCTSAMTSLVSLSASIEKQLNHAIRLGVTSLGDFVRCAYEAPRFQRFLAHWMSSILCVLYSSTEINGPQEEMQKEQALKKVEFFVGQLRDILHKAFTGCPAEQWISIGMQFALLTAGDIQLFELSKRLQSEYLNEQTGTKTSDVWATCLLHALRNYVDTCTPQPSLQPGTKLKKLESLPPNERLARHCLSLFISLDSRTPLNRSMKRAFEMEQCLLDVSAFLSSVTEHLPSAQQSLPTAPVHLRPVWVTESESMQHRRNTIFSIALLAMLKSLRRSHGNRRKFLEILGTDSLFRIGRLFSLSLVTTIECFVQATYKYLVTTFSQALPIEVTDHVLELVIQSTKMSHPSAWLICAQWAGHFSEKNKPCLIESVNSVMEWTALHGLFRIARPRSTDSESSIRYNRETLIVELFRVWLARYALTHGPTDYLTDLCRLLAICWYRLENHLTEDLVEAQLGILPQPLQALTRELQSLLSDKMPRHYSALYGNSSIVNYARDECVPYVYLPLDSSTGDIFSTLFNAKRDLNPVQTIDVTERSWWRLFLHHWISTQLSPEPFHYPSQEVLSLPTAAGDIRLLFAYAALEATFVKLGGSIQNDEDLFQLNRIAKEQSSNDEFRLEPVSLTDQLQLSFLTYAFGVWVQSLDCDHSSDCFISGERAISILSSSRMDVVPEMFRRAVDYFCYKALAQRLCNRTTALLPDFDYIRFHEDEAYKHQIIQTLSATHFIVGARLCLYTDTPLTEAFNARLVHLFLEEPKWSSEVEREITCLVTCLLRFPDDVRSAFSEFCEETIYPSLQEQSRLRLLFKLLKADCFDEIPVGTHQAILTLLASDPDCSNLLEQIGYAHLVTLLKSPLSTDSNSWRIHELAAYLTTEHVVETLAKVLLLLSSVQFCLPTGDLYAMYGLNVLQDESSCERVRNKSSSLNSLLHDICLPDYAFARLHHWVEQLIFHKLASRLTIEQRRWILTETVNFLKSSRDDSVEADVRLKTLERIQMYLVQFDLVVRHLSTVPFPHIPGMELEPDQHLPSGFYAEFLILLPGVELEAVALLEQLIVLVSSSTELEGLRETNDKLAWFANYLPSCLHVVQLPWHVQTTLLVKAASSLMIPYTSLFDYVLAESGMVRNEDSMGRSEMLIKLFHYIHTSVERLVALKGQETNTYSLFIALVGAMLCNCAIRRLHGPSLVQKLLSDSSSMQRTKSTPMAIYEAALKFLSAESNFPCKALQTLAHATASSQASTAGLVAFADSVLSEALALNAEDSNQRRAALLRLSDQLQTVIELFILLFGNDFDFTPPESEDLSCVPVQLWTRWFDLCHSSGLFAESNFSLSAYLLLKQWVKYGRPPHDLAVAALDALKRSSSDSAQWPSALQANVLGICLCQTDRPLVLDSLNTLCSSESLSCLIDLDVCRSFVCTHGSLWSELARPSEISSHLHCPSLFRHILRAVELFLSNQACDSSDHLFSTHCLTLLRQADLWIEAARLARILHPAPTEYISFQTIIKLVRGGEPS